MASRTRWRWLLAVALGAVALGWALARAGRGMSDDEAAAYGAELERMQDA